MIRCRIGPQTALQWTLSAQGDTLYDLHFCIQRIIADTHGFFGRKALLLVCSGNDYGFGHVFFLLLCFEIIGVQGAFCHRETFDIRRLGLIQFFMGAEALFKSPSLVGHGRGQKLRVAKNFLCYHLVSDVSYKPNYQTIW